jgi:hypothetical protein
MWLFETIINDFREKKHGSHERNMNELVVNSATCHGEYNRWYSGQKWSSRTEIFSSFENFIKSNPIPFGKSNYKKGEIGVLQKVLKTIIEKPWEQQQANDSILQRREKLKLREQWRTKIFELFKDRTWLTREEIIERNKNVSFDLIDVWLKYDFIKSKNNDVLILSDYLKYTDYEVGEKEISHKDFLIQNNIILDIEILKSQLCQIRNQIIDKYYNIPFAKNQFSKNSSLNKVLKEELDSYNKNPLENYKFQCLRILFFNFHTNPIEFNNNNFIFKWFSDNDFILTDDQKLSLEKEIGPHREILINKEISKLTKVAYSKYNIYDHSKRHKFEVLPIFVKCLLAYFYRNDHSIPENSIQNLPQNLNLIDKLTANDIENIENYLTKEELQNYYGYAKVYLEVIRYYKETMRSEIDKLDLENYKLLEYPKSIKKFENDTELILEKVNQQSLKQIDLLYQQILLQDISPITVKIGDKVETFYGQGVVSEISPDRWKEKKIIVSFPKRHIENLSLTDSAGNNMYKAAVKVGEDIVPYGEFAGYGIGVVEAIASHGHKANVFFNERNIAFSVPNVRFQIIESVKSIKHDKSQIKKHLDKKGANKQEIVFKLSREEKSDSNTLFDEYIKGLNL